MTNKNNSLSSITFPETYYNHKVSAPGHNLVRQDTDIVIEKLRSFSNIAHLRQAKTLTNCFFNVEVLPNSFINPSDRYFPKSKKSKSFFGRSKINR